MEDAQLVRQFLDGDDFAFNTLVQRWEKPIFLFRFTGISVTAMRPWTSAK